MSQLKAGVGRSIITPHIGAALIGYFNRPLSNVVHDDLNARALVLDDGSTTIAFCSIELCWLSTADVEAMRAAISKRTPLKPENIFLVTTHTHSGPSPQNRQDWDRPLEDIVADAVVQAYENRVDAALASGFGQLFGYNINRRWLNRPADPSVGVIRVDRADGTPLAVLGNYACHAVVMGYDSAAISGDWPGYASRQLEADLGHGSVVMFSQGGAGDVNPLTEVVRLKLEAGYPVVGIGELSTYYGDHGGPETPETYNIGDRGGGTFLECDILARAYVAEVKRIYRGLNPKADAPLWVDRVMVDGNVGPDEPKPTGLSEAHKSLLQDYVNEVGKARQRTFGPLTVEITLLGLGDALLLGQPGEVFSENSISFRKTAQQKGYKHPMLLSYANGSFAYLPPANAFIEGGYEVDWALRLGISRYLQDRIDAAMVPLLEKYKPG